MCECVYVCVYVLSLKFITTIYFTDVPYYKLRTTILTSFIYAKVSLFVERATRLRTT